MNLIFRVVEILGFSFMAWTVLNIGLMYILPDEWMKRLFGWQERAITRIGRTLRWLLLVGLALGGLYGVFLFASSHLLAFGVTVIVGLLVAILLVLINIANRPPQ